MANYLIRQGKMLTKIMHGSAKKKKFRFNMEPAALPTPSSISKNTKTQGSSRRRVFVLNKLFMKYITEIMAMGSIGTDILGRGVEISRVKINSDYNKVNVYWLAKGTENDSKIGNILKESAGKLRHELSQLRVMGEVPHIEFVKDKYYAVMVEVDECLKQADFGDDYIPTTDISNRLRSEFSLNSSLSEDLKNKLLLLENDSILENTVIEDALPVMTSNIFSLDQSKIMKKVKQAIQQSNIAWKKSHSNIAFSNESFMLEKQEIQQDCGSLENITYNERKQKFAEFLKKRQIERNKAMRKEKHRTQLEKDFILNNMRIDVEDEQDILLQEDECDDDLEELK